MGAIAYLAAIAVLGSDPLAQAPAASQASSPAHAPAPASKLAEVRVGASVAGLSLPLTPQPLVGLRLGWLRQLRTVAPGLTVEVSLQHAALVGSGRDTRLPGDRFTYALVQDTLGISLGPTIFFLPLGRRLVPWASLGVQARFVTTTSEANANAQTGPATEMGVGFALRAQVGLGYRFGPGYLSAHVEGAARTLRQRISGAVLLADVTLSAGYLVAL